MVIRRGRRRPPSAAETEVDAPAETVLRLAVLLQAGLSPARAWEHLAASGDAAAGRVHAALAAGVPLTRAVVAAENGADAARGRVAGGRRLLRGSGRRPAGPPAGRRSDWTDVAAAWTVATTVGAPLAESLRGLAAALRDGREAADEVRVALAEPAATARLMAWLPLVAVALGAAFGFDTVATLFTNPLGVTCLVAGVALILAGRAWNARLVRAAAPEGGIPGLDGELLAIALSGGVSIERGRRIVSDATGRDADAAADAVLALSRAAGVPAVDLLRAAASLARHRARVDGRLRAARLSTRLLLPLGVCTLPAFLLLGVAPMMLSVMTAVPLSL